MISARRAPSSNRFNPLKLCPDHAAPTSVEAASRLLRDRRAVMSEHRWIVAVIYELSDDEARRAATGEVVNLQHRHRIGVDGPGCLNCERPYEEVHGTPCDSPAVEGDR
jgi:hypothetical protein